MDGLKQNYRARSRLEVFYTGGSVRLSNDGTTLACACADEVKLVDVETGATTKTFPGDTEPVTSLALSIDARLLFVASRSLQLRCFSVETGQQLRSFKGHRAPVADMAVDSTGALLATASADRSVRVWDIDGGFCTHNFTGHSGVVLCCAFHPTQLLLATGGDDSQVRVWDLVTKTCVATLKAHFSAVTSLSITPDGWTLLSASRDGVVIAWSLRDFSKLATVPVYEAVEGVVALSPAVCGLVDAPKSAVCFATGGDKGVVKIWRSDTARCLFDSSPPEVGTPTAAGGIVELRPLPQGTGLLAATQDCRLLLLDAVPAQGRAGPALGLRRQLIGNNDEVTDLRFITAESEDPAEDNQNAKKAAAVPAPTHLAVATNGEHIRLFDAATLSCTATLAGHTEAVLCLDAVRLKSGRTLLASGSKDNTLRLWAPLPSGRCLGVGTGHVGAVSAVAFARKGAGFVVTGGADKLLKVWDLSSVDLDGGDKPVALQATAAVAAHAKDINAVAVAPNDSVVATASQDRTIKVWALPALVPTLTLKGHRRGVWSVAFSPVDRALVSASGDKTIKLWSLADGACLRTFEGHLASVLRVGFVSSGTQLLSTGGDGLMKLWNMRTSECINTFDAADDKVWALALGGADGGLAATGGADGGIAVWEDCTASDAAGAAADAAAALLKEQALSNAVHSRDWKKAAALAFEMRHPGRLLAVVNAALEAGPEAGGQILRAVAADLDALELKQCLEYCREWNTNGRTCHAAQAMLGAVLRTHGPGELASIQGVGPLLEAVEAYTRRHFARTDRLLRSTFVVDYVLSGMKVLAPAGEEEEEERGEKAAAAAVPNGHAHGDGEETSSSSDEDEEMEEVEEVEEEEKVTEEQEKKKKRKSTGGSGSGGGARQTRRQAAAAAAAKPKEATPKSAAKKRRSARK